MSRAKERFSNFEKVFIQLQEALNTVNPTFLELAGIIKLFELVIELGLKTLKDILEEENLLKNESLISPRRVIKTSVQSHLLNEEEGTLWLKGLENRNLLVHTYNYELAKQCKQDIQTVYFPMLKKLYTKLKEELK